MNPVKTPDNMLLTKLSEKTYTQTKREIELGNYFGLRYGYICVQSRLMCMF